MELYGHVPQMVRRDDSFVPSAPRGREGRHPRHARQSFPGTDSGDLGASNAFTAGDPMAEARDDCLLVWLTSRR